MKSPSNHAWCGSTPAHEPTQSAQRFAKHSLSELEKKVYPYILKQTINVQHSIRLRKATARQDAQHSTLNCSRFALRTAELQSLICAFRAARRSALQDSAQWHRCGGFRLSGRESDAAQKVGKARVRPQVVNFGIDLEIVEVESAVRVFLVEICKGPLFISESGIDGGDAIRWDIELFRLL